MSSRRDLILELAKKSNREPNSSRDNTDTNSKAQVQNDDYVARVKSVNSMKTIVKEMNFTDFYNYDECVSQHKIRNSSPRIYLKDITYVKAERGYFTLKFKKDQDDEDFQTLNFLQNKVLKNKTFPELKPKAAPRGITEEKKKEILEKLVTLMPENRRAFWLNIPTSNASDLED